MWSISQSQQQPEENAHSHKCHDCGANAKKTDAQLPVPHRGHELVVGPCFQQLHGSWTCEPHARHNDDHCRTERADSSIGLASGSGAFTRILAIAPERTRLPGAYRTEPACFSADTLPQSRWHDLRSIRNAQGGRPLP